MNTRPRSAGEIRESWLDFFEKRGHRRVASSSLIPHDSSLLLTTAGMVQFKPYMLGEEIPPYKRAASVQKCFRTTDVDRVGVTDRHFTFFEMLGNFSFGDYFKQEAIEWAWELVTQLWELPEERLWVTVYEEDAAAAELWERIAGVPRERIVPRGKEDNFWDMGTAGPCGPCSEIYYDRGEAFGEGGGPAHNDVRYVELWNLVFMELVRDERGAVVGELPQKNIDTGAGLERVAMVLQGAASVFEVDTTLPILEAAQDVTGVAYGDDPTSDVSLRVLTDHSRAVAFLVADGVFPSNEDRGYVLRRILRRAVRHARLLGTDDPVVTPLALRAVDLFAEAYPELARNKSLVEKVCGTEEQRFSATLSVGLQHLEEALASLRPGEALPGETAFRLHDTYGFPIDLTKEIAAERGYSVDEAGFSKEMESQRRRARAATKQAASSEDPAHAALYKSLLDENGPTRFVGYDRLEDTGRILALIRDGSPIDMASTGETAVAVLDVTPFYGEAGGQVGDRGEIVTETGRARVVDASHPLFELTAHVIEVVEGAVFTGQEATAKVDRTRRERTMRHHTATHVLHWALREVLGNHVKQAGSLVAPDRLRFDFTHFEAVRPEEMAEIEFLANSKILTNQPVITFETTKEEAERLGALAFFGDKYGEIVRVVQAGDFSRELCGGTHVHYLGEVGPILLQGESSIGSNLRRVEALAGAEAAKALVASRTTLSKVAATLKTSPDKLADRIEQMLSDMKAAQQQAKRMREMLAAARAESLAKSSDVLETQWGRALVSRLDEASEFLRDTTLRLRDRHGFDVVVLGGTEKGRANLVAAVSTRAAERGADASAMLSEAAAVVGGGTGKGKELAVGGGPKGDALDEALRRVAAALGNA